MAKNIPIWAGSSSFFPGDTPFGLYDNDVKFQSDVDKVSDWCAKRLGYPITDIELQPLNFFACFEEAISEYGAQVNTYNIRDNMLNLYGSATGSNLSGQKVSPNFGGLVELAEEYGTEAGSGGNVTYYTGSISVTKNQQVYDLTDATKVNLESGESTKISFLLTSEDFTYVNDSGERILEKGTFIIEILDKQIKINLI